jgi:hypothetical protein
VTGREREIKIALGEEGLVRLHALLRPAANVVLQRNHYLDNELGDLRRRKHGLRLRLEVPLPPVVLEPPEDAVHRILLPLPAWEQAPGQPPSLAWLDPRPAPERYILSLKGPSTRRGDWVDRMDEQAEISHSLAGDIILGGADARSLPLPHLVLLAEELNLDRVQVLGAADNLRRVYPLDLRAGGGPGQARAHPLLHLEVDSTRYPDGTVEHEAELELPPTLLPPRVQAPPAQPILLDADAVSAAVRALVERAGVPWIPSLRGKYARFLERSGLSG